MGYTGYVFRITGGNDLQGFPMKQGVLTQGRTRLLLKKGLSCYRERRSGMRKRKSVRGCIVGPDLSVCNLVLVKKGDKDIEGLTNVQVPLRLGPKRASKIRKLFNLNQGKATQNPASDYSRCPPAQAREKGGEECGIGEG